MAHEPSDPLDEIAPAPGAAAPNSRPHAKFHLAPPRNFQYPAVLLLLAEEPRHGYRLIDALLRLGFGPIDRACVYRTLADLHDDGLVVSWPEEPTAGCVRHVYGLTPLGERALHDWMQILDEERHGIEDMERRYAKFAVGDGELHLG